MRSVAVGAVLAVLLALSGCAADPSGTDAGTADCSAQVRSKGVIYTSAGYTEREAKKFGTAEQADCRDVGEDAAGSVYPDSANHVATWTFDGYPPMEVLGVRFDQRSFAVFVADSVSPEDRERIYEELGQPAR